MKRHKDPVSPPAKTGETQVFVLPPDLLEKLGIQLSNISSPSGSSKNSSVGQSTINNTEDIISSGYESSILETANLMKQSVFMSPTFVSTPANETTNELNLHNIVTETKESIQDDNIQIGVNNEDTLVFNEDINPTYNVTLQSEDLEKYQSIKEYEVENGDLVLTNVSYETRDNINIKQSSNEISCVDDHADEAYSSDGSNSNSGTCSEITSNNLEATLKTQKPSNKIKILSEQIINNLDLNTIQSSRIQKRSNSCFIIPVNTIVTGKTTKYHSNNQLQQNNDQEEICSTTDIITKVDNKIGEEDITNHLEIVINKDTMVENSPSETHSVPGATVLGVLKEETSHKDEFDDGNNKSEVILNIDIHSNDEKNKNNYFRDDSEDKKLKVNKMNDTVKDIVSNTEKSSFQSKLCIQGVEKPGGMNENESNTVLKTYQRTNIRKTIPELPHFETINVLDSNLMLEDVATDLDHIFINGYKNADKFCICSDFGLLANYDSDIVYEHIHYGDNNSVGCNLETLFSIYDETFVLRELNITDEIDAVNEVEEATPHNICWLSFIHENNDETEELDTNPCQLRRSNRKRKSTATEHVTESVGHKSKKTVNCGACGLMLSEAEWDKHKDSEHNLIAWKDGQSIDLKNKGLLKKLGLKLKKYGVLKCTFCKTDIKYLSKFVQHVKRCIKRKVENISTAIHCETLSVKALENNDITPKVTQTTRRSSRNLNLGIDVSEISIDNTRKPKIHHDLKPKIHHDHVDSDSKIIRSASKESAIECKSNKSVTCKQIETSSISKRKLIETSSKLAEKDGVTSKSIKKSVDVVSPKPTKKLSSLENSPKSKNMSISVASCSKPIVKTLATEEPARCTRKSKLFEGTTKSTEAVTTLKPKRISLDVLSTSEIKDTLQAELKDTEKLTRRKSDGSLKATQHKVTQNSKTKVSTKSMKTLVNDSTATDIKNTQKAEIEDTPKVIQKSIDISKTTKTVEIPKSRRISRTIDIEVTTVSSLSQEGEATSKTTRNSIDDAGHPKPTPKDKDVDVFSKSNVANTNTKSKSIDASNKSTRKSVEAVEVSSKSNQKPTCVEVSPTSKRRLQEVDLFSSPTPRRTVNIESQLRSTKQSKNVTDTSKPKSTSSTDVSSKQIRKSLEVEDSNKLKRKLIDTEASTKGNRKSIDTKLKSKEVDVSAVQTDATSKRNSFDASVSSKILRQYSRDKDTKETKEVTTTSPSKEAKKNNTPSKTITKSEQYSKSKKRSSDTIKCTGTENVINPKSSKKSHTASVQVPPVDSSQKSVSMEIEIPAQTDIMATDNTTTSASNTEQVAASSDSNSEHIKINSNTTSKDLNNPQPVEKNLDITIKEEIFPKCGVCKQPVDESLWMEHIAKEHDYLAWREDETPLNLQDDEEIRNHLYTIVKANGPLKCSKCHSSRKYAKSFLTHIRACYGTDDDQSQMDASTTSVDMDTTLDLDDVPLKSYPRKMPLLQRSVICGVCDETILGNKWIDHIRMEHKYLAWKKGEPALDLEDRVAVKIFLQNISNYNGGLVCSKCGTVRSYVKKYLEHVAVCKENNANLSSSSLLESTLNESTSKETAKLIEIEISAENVKCAKCGEEMPSKTWIDHIEKKHNYFAWIEGQPPLEENNPEAVSAYLHALVKKRGVLYCAKCGVTRKYPKAFLTHISACEISGFKREDFFVEVSAQAKPGEYECAVCHETGPRKDWKKHAMTNHYNVAWMAGDIPINLKNPYAVEKYIKEYRTKHNLVCKVCGASRASCYGFYAHILTCGKTEEELEYLMEMCDICNNKFLCIYRNQHKAMHKEQMIKKEKKERDAIKAEEEIIAKAKASAEDGEPMGKRRAAEKAKKVMEKYTSNIQDGSHVCLSCHIEFEKESQLMVHECLGTKLDDASDSDVSVKLEDHEESEDDMEIVDSSISDEEEQDPSKRKRQHETIPKIILPFKVKDFNYYLAKSFDNFCELHYTSDRLFNQWQSNDYKILSEDESVTYLPSLSESCKLRIVDDQWETFKRFEARKKKDITMFTGAAIRCMKWVPQSFTQEVQDQYLSIACFPDADCPRYGKEQLPEHPGMLQIWNFERFISLPKFEMGLAFDYGTIWAMDWCPSGARDNPLECKEGCRLGLLAIACSNGCAYILSVPLFNTEAQDKPIICNLKPAAELRLSVNPKQPPFRMGYQATSISWSPQKGHDIVIVGYADGTTAMYDLNTESPFLKATEDGVDIFYPFHDALAENSTITGVALCASEDFRRAVGGVASASITGATMSGWPRGPVVRSHLAASSVSYTPNWPAALLCSDDVLTMKSTNEMEWWGGGRRLGGACAAGACARCGRVCLTAPPFVRVLRAHPVYPELKKQIVATLKMVPIARKRKFKVVNDDLGMIVEPLTYDEAIKKYGLEFKLLPKKDQNVASKLCDNAEQCAERFPLSDLPAAAFCPSAEHHSRLAIASHAGLIFIIST